MLNFVRWTMGFVSVISLLSSSSSSSSSQLFVLGAPMSPSTTQLMRRQFNPSPTATPSATIVTSMFNPYPTYNPNPNTAPSAPWGNSPDNSSTWPRPGAGNPFQNPFFDNATRSGTITIVVVTLFSIIAILLVALRVYCVKKNYPLSIRSLLVPPSGYHVKRLGISIDAPIPNAPTGPPPMYVRGPNGPRRRRPRGHLTNGEGIAEGGAREGERDEDDSWDGESGSDQEKEGLPRYAIDSDLPAYHQSATASTTEDGTPSMTGGNGLMTAREYEIATRQAPAGEGVTRPEQVLTRDMTQVERRTSTRSASAAPVGMYPSMNVSMHR